MHQKRYLICSAVLAVLFLLLSLLVWLHPAMLSTIDHLFSQWPLHRSDQLDTFFGAIAATATIIPITAALLLLSIGLCWRRSWTLMIWLWGNLILISGLGKGIKSMIARPRPSFAGHAERASFSFPSGHTLLAVTFVLTCIVIFPYLMASESSRRQSHIRKWVMAGGMVYILLVMMTRVYFGVHYPSDLLASLCLSGSVSSLTYSVFVHFSESDRAVASNQIK